jgi:pre-mRNA-splicing factor ATP-dependent RNA helicase DHX15/PRP43
MNKEIRKENKKENIVSNEDKNENNKEDNEKDKKDFKKFYEDVDYTIGIFDPEGKNPNPFNNQPYSDTYKNLAKFWSNLPAYSAAKDLAKAICENDVILAISGTGSGKTVILNKVCLAVTHYKGRIITTLPKKLITKRAATFGAQMLDVELGEQVGYQFRGDNMKSDKTKLLYSTDGSVISQIINDPMLKRIDIVVIDEAHERKVQIDLLLYLLKNAIVLRREKGIRPLKLIIMSATINEELFKSYFSELKFHSMFLSGTPNFPIESIYLETPLNVKSNQYLEKGKEIVKNIVSSINKGDKKFMEGDILFFVCTVAECENTAEELGEKIKDSFIMPIYSGFDSELEQYISDKDKYKELNPSFKRRIFVSTNVAESSLTIDGIVYVIDSGLELSVKFNPEKNINIMDKHYITKAQMTQRKGRAGRTKPGVCYHLYTVQEEENAQGFPDPEIKRIDIKNTCLTMLKLGTDLYEKEGKPESYTVEDAINTFTHFIEPPSEAFIMNGFDFAITNNLINLDMVLSPIGKLVTESKLDVMDGLSLLYAYNISSSEELFKDVFMIICICTNLKKGIKDFFYDDIPTKKRDTILDSFAGNAEKSEHVLLLNLFNHVQNGVKKGIFNFGLVDSINKLFNKQYEKIKKLFDQHQVKLDDVKIDKNHTKNIIYCFNYGYRANKAYRSGGIFKYNDTVCDLSKSHFDYKKENSLIFYLNLYISGRLNIMICSPFLL